MNKKFILPMSMILAISCLASCGGNPSTSTGGNSTIDDGDIVRDDDGNIIYNNVELKLWSVTSGDDANVQETIIQAFNEAYQGQIYVSTEHISRYDLETNLTSTMEFDRAHGPDILFNHGMKVTEYVDRDWLQPIEAYYKKADITLDKSDFVDSLLDCTTVDGQMYATPIDCHSTMMEIRKDILDKNHLSIPTNYIELCELSKTVNEMVQANNFYIRGENAEGKSATEWRLASTAEPFQIFPIAYGDMWVHEFVDYTAAVQNGAELIGNDGMPTWKNEGTKTGMQILRNWMWPDDSSENDYMLSKPYGSDYDVGDAPFKQGTCLFKLQGPWTYKKDCSDFDILLSKDGGKNNITTRSISKMFAKDPTKPYANLIKGEGHSLMLTKCTTSTTKGCAAAVFADYLAYFSGITWAKSGHIPAVKSVVNSSDFQQDPAYDEYIKYWGNPTDYTVVPPTKYYSYSDTYFKGVAQQAMSAADKETPIDTILNKQFEDCLGYIELYAD